MTCVLEDNDETITQVCPERYSTLSLVVPLVDCMQLLPTNQAGCQGEESSFSANPLRSIKTRFVDLKMCTIFALAIILDPRLQDVCCTTSTEKQFAKTLLQTTVKCGLPPPTDNRQGEAAQSSKERLESLSAVWAVFSELASNSTLCSSWTEYREQFEEYYIHKYSLDRISLSSGGSLLGSLKYPLLAKTAQKFLAIPATQVASARMLSTSVDTVMDRRELLLPEQVEQLVLLRDNSLLIELEGSSNEGPKVSLCLLPYIRECVSYSLRFEVIRLDSKLPGHMY